MTVTRWWCPVCGIKMIDLDDALSYVERPGAQYGEHGWLVCSDECVANYRKPGRQRRASTTNSTPTRPRDYRSICWVRISMYSGDPLWKPREHLTLDGRTTCCGRPIPRIGQETRDWRVEEWNSSLECEKCFTEDRKEEMRKRELWGSNG